MGFDSVHSIHGSEEFLHKTFSEIGFPPLYILGGRLGQQMKYYEFSSDEEKVFAGLKWGEDKKK
jgi:hypothetical protein